MTAASLRVLAGSFVSLQDAGRLGHARLGVGAAGPMDPLARLLAVRLAGIDATATATVPTIEAGPDGTRLRAEGSAVVLAIAGHRARAAIGPDTIAAPAVVHLGEGDEVVVDGARWSIVCPVGELDATRVLGSVSWHGRTGIGVRLTPGDAVGVRSRIPAHHDRAPVADDRGRRTTAPQLGERAALPAPGTELLLLPGPQTHLFDDEARASLVGPGLTVAPVGDRMAQRLDGVRIHARGGHDIVSDGVVAGAVQVQGDGAPWVLGAEHQPTGGYPKVAVLAAADRGRFAQLGPGAPVSWRWGTVDEARARWARAVGAIEECVAGPVRPTADRLRGAPLEGAGVATDDEQP